MFLFATFLLLLIRRYLLRENVFKRFMEKSSTVTLTNNFGVGIISEIRSWAVADSNVTGHVRARLSMTKE